jgi:DNA primase
MAKISPVSIKYNILADFLAEGPLEKPDVIGAIFGQTEGLLGNALELRELQKEGKIGRIDVEIESEGGKTKGEIIIPTALDKTETAIIGAAIETIDKIGPTSAKITIREIEDIRGSKRDYIMDRAKKLLAGFKGNGMETQEMQQHLQESTRLMKIAEYGDEKLPCGDLSGNEIIVTEGRADVVNLLKHGINNVIGMNGTKFPVTISKLSEEKELTLFVDGDRGGKLIAKNVCDNAKIAYIAQAPDGKEVEELAGKEIHMALRRKVSPKEFFASSSRERYENSREDRRDNREDRRYDRDDQRDDRDNREQETKQSDKVLAKEDKTKLRDMVENLSDRSVLLLNSNLEIIRELPISKLPYFRAHDVFVILANTANSMVAQAAEEYHAKYVAAKTFNRIESTSFELVSL